MSDLHELRECAQVLEGMSSVMVVTIIRDDAQDVGRLEVTLDNSDGTIPPHLSDVFASWAVSLDVDASASRPDSTRVVLRR